MSYIGNNKSPLIFGPNTRDDIVPDGGTSVFNLSQEVPGGYEANITVLRQRYIKQKLVTGTTAITYSLAPDELIISGDQDLSAAFSRVNIGDFIEIEGTPVPSNIGVWQVLNVDYDGSTITISLNGNLVSTGPSLVTDIFSHGFFGPWEVLEPETDYTISGIGNDYNKQISFNYIPPESERIYVVHHGEATYNFVPTQGSVGPDQLQPNLRNFVVDRYTGNAIKTTFALSQPAIDSRSLVVTLDGIVTDGDSISYSGGIWNLTESVPSSGIFDQITFDTPPANGTAIRILHLTFSTVSRRALYSPAQLPYVVQDNSVSADKLQNNSVTASKLADNSVDNSAIIDDSVSGNKILLNNNEYLRSLDNTSSPQGIIKLDTSNNISIESPNDINVNADIIPSTPTTLGSNSNPFGAIHTNGPILVDGGTVTIDSGTVTAQSANISGNITVAGTVDGVDVSSLNAQVQALVLGFPAGVVLPFAGNVVPFGWLLCDGSSYNISSYPTLHSVIGYQFGGGGSTFNVPNMGEKFPLGLGGALSLGDTGGQFDHYHQVPDHTHDDIHTHTVAGHNHENLVSQGSTLSVTIPSGTHTTSIGHSHTGSIPSSGVHEHFLGSTGQNLPINRQVYASNESIPVSGIYPDREPKHNHTISASSDNESSTHTHTVNMATENDPTLAEHTHNIKTVNIQSAGAYSSGDPHFVVANGPTILRDIHPSSATYDGQHTHSYTAVTTGQSAPHNHDFSQPTDTTNSEHDHIVRGTVPNTNSAHSHSLVIDTLSANSVSTGEHTHPTNSLTGKIGKVTGGVSGDSNITTSQRSVSVTGQVSSPGPGTTDAANPPYIVLNYIIKF
jgi:microcystin-dependent protein